MSSTNNSKNKTSINSNENYYDSDTINQSVLKDGVIDDNLLNSYILSLEEKYKDFSNIYDNYGYLKDGDYLNDPNFKEFFVYSFYDFINILKEEGHLPENVNSHNEFLNKMHEQYLQKYCDLVNKNVITYTKSGVQLLREQRQKRATKNLKENSNVNNEN